MQPEMVSRPDLAARPEMDLRPIPAEFAFPEHDVVVPVEYAAQPAPVAAEVGVSPEGDGFHLTDRKWGGLFPLYECDTCDYTSVDRAQIVDHVEMAAERNEELGYDPLGNPLHPEEVVP